jgi:hypothetical protein
MGCKALRQRNSFSPRRRRRLYAPLQQVALNGGGQTAYNWFTGVVSRSGREPAVSNASRWRVLREPRYLRFAVPGMILWGLSLPYRGQGTWPLLAAWVGIALIVLPLPTSKPKDRTKTPGQGSSKWTGIR